MTALAELAMWAVKAAVDWATSSAEEKAQLLADGDAKWSACKQTLSAENVDADAAKTNEEIDALAAKKFGYQADEETKP